MLNWRKYIVSHTIINCNKPYLEVFPDPRFWDGGLLAVIGRDPGNGGGRVSIRGAQQANPITVKCRIEYRRLTALPKTTQMLISLSKILEFILYCILLTKCETS